MRDIINKQNKIITKICLHEHAQFYFRRNKSKNNSCLKSSYFINKCCCVAASGAEKVFRLLYGNTKGNDYVKMLPCLNVRFNRASRYNSTQSQNRTE